MAMRAVALTVNGDKVDRFVEPRKTLADFLREDVGLTGTKLGCEHGVCGACTVLMNDDAVRSCLLLAVQADGADVLTIESLASGDEMHPIQQAFRERHGLQCGFCTPGMLMSVRSFLDENADPNEEEIRVALSGNICRCTGYEGIVEAVQLAAERLRTAAPTGAEETGGLA